MKLKDLNAQIFVSEFEKALERLLANGDTAIEQGMRYATLDGGKRIRPLCVFLGARAVGSECDLDKVMRLALAIELVHSYSLVHDDLPAMDNDDFRRGKPSVHKQFGHANAILIGDQLLSEAMSVLLDGAIAYGDQFARAGEEIAFGAKQMVLGQMRDLDGCKSEKEYLDMYEKKTGYLIKSAFRAGAVIAGANFEQLENIGEFARNIGIGFQLADDLLDDDENSILSVASAEDVKRMLEEKTKRACEIARSFKNGDELISFAKMLCQRKK